MAIVLWFVIVANRVEARLQALRAEGTPTSYAEWTEKYQVPPGTANAAEVYTMAFRAYYKPVDDVNTPHARQAKLPSIGQPLPEPMVEAATDFVTANKGCLDLLREARGIEASYYNWDYSQDIEDLAQVRKCAQLLATAALLRTQQGDVDAALAYVDDALHMGRSLRNEPSLISHLVHLACIGICIDPLERALNQQPFTEEQLLEVDRMMVEALSTIDLTKAMMAEQCSSIEMIRNPSMMEGGNLSPARIPGFGSIGTADMLDYMGKCIEASKLPLAERAERFREISEELDQLSPVHIVAKMLAPALGRVSEIDARCQMQVGTVRTAVAIERYRLATGKVPEDLGTLVPKYLNQVPMDVYDGKPIRYRRTEPGYMLYSVWDDREDNEGKSKEQVPRRAPHDWPFVVMR